MAVADLASQLGGAGGLATPGRAAPYAGVASGVHTEERSWLGGTANLTCNAVDFGGSSGQYWEALEEQVVVLRLPAAQQEAGKVTVR